RADEIMAGETGADETALIWLGGRARVDGFAQVGERDDVFSGLPSALLLPPGASYTLRALTPLRHPIRSAPAEPAPAPRLSRSVAVVRVGRLPSMPPSAPATMTSSWCRAALTWSPPRRDPTAIT